MGTLQGIIGIHKRNGGLSQARHTAHSIIPNTQNATIDPNPSHYPSFSSRTSEEAEPNFSSFD